MIAITATIFDTLAYAKKLIAAGFTDARALAVIIEERLATKQDLKDLELYLKLVTLLLGGMLIAGIVIAATLGTWTK
ncbi:MAG: hypothetical protein JRE64_04525 [Deltaproteobacteria bacterium]|nr:hypothetical protein [Deltaproteobacteria bacterium]